MKELHVAGQAVLSSGLYSAYQSVSWTVSTWFEYLFFFHKMDIGFPELDRYALGRVQVFDCIWVEILMYDWPLYYEDMEVNWIWDT